MKNSVFNSARNMSINTRILILVKNQAVQDIWMSTIHITSTFKRVFCIKLVFLEANHPCYCTIDLFLTHMFHSASLSFQSVIFVSKCLGLSGGSTGWHGVAAATSEKCLATLVATPVGSFVCCPSQALGGSQVQMCEQASSWRRQQGVCVSPHPTSTSHRKCQWINHTYYDQY